MAGKKAACRGGEVAELRGRLDKLAGTVDTALRLYQGGQTLTGITVERFVKPWLVVEN